MNEDLNIFQYPGCGGMYLLYQLLLTNKFTVEYNLDNFKFEKEKILLKEKYYKDIKNIVFNIENPDNWKKTEVEPDNNLTLKLENTSNRIFYTFRDFKQWHNYPGKKVFLYTDIRSQIRLCWYKKCSWFIDKNNHSYKFFVSTVKWLLSENKDVYKPSRVIMKKVDIIIKFQDLLTVEGLEKELNKFGCEINQDNIDFLNQYLSLHSPKLLKKLGIEI